MVNATITAADGELWIAAEWYDIGANPLTLSLDLFWFDGTSWDRKTLAADALTIDLAAAEPRAMYPSITTWSGATYVYTTGKQDLTPSGTEPHLTSFRQDRDNLLAATSQTDVGTSVGADIKHGRPHLTSDFDYNDAMLLCWTRVDESEPIPDDDLKRKGKNNIVAWTANSTNTLEASADDQDDHCQQGVDSEGTIWTSFHSDKSSNDRMYINHSSYDVSTDSWTSHASNLPDLPTGWANVDFPSLSVGEVVYGPDVRVIVAERMTDSTNQFDEIAWWRCEGATASCDLAGDWVEGEYNPSGVSNAMRQPMVAVDRIFGHAFTLFELAQGNIGVAKWCSGDTAWSDVGVVDVHNDHNQPVDHKWGEVAGSPLAVLATDWYDEPMLHAVFLAEPDNGGSRDNNLMHWSMPIEDLCP